MTVHDHFDGSAHCIECAGWCSLTGESRTMTELVRNLMEFFAFSDWEAIPPLIHKALSTLLGAERCHALWQRAQRTH